MPKRPKCPCKDPNAAAILARISDKEKQGQVSLEEQVRQTQEMLVEPRGWHVVAEYLVKHRGSDLSHDTTYMRMIRDARAGKFSKLCLHKFDRFARRAYDREVFEHIITRECSIDVFAALEPYDLKTRAGKLTKKTSAFISDVFLDNLAEETMKGMMAKVTNGGWVARAPFGYVNKREEIGHNKFRRWVEVDPINGETVKVVFRLFAGGQHTLDTLTEWLNGQGHFWHSGRRWRRDRLHRLLTNSFYTGLVKWNGIEAQGVHEPLVAPDTFEQCRAILRRHDSEKVRQSRHVYALNRLLWFSELSCGSHAEHQAHVGLSYYRSKAPGPDGSKICLRCDLVDRQVGQLLLGIEIPQWLHPRIRRIYRQEVAEMVDPQRLDVERLKRRIADLEEENQGYVRLCAQGKITESEFDNERARVSLAIAKSRAELAAMEQHGRSTIDELDLALKFFGRASLLWERAGVAHRKAIAHLVFKRIDVDNSGTIVGYRLNPPLEHLLQLKKACSPPSKAGLNYSNAVRYALPNPSRFRNVVRPSSEASPRGQGGLLEILRSTLRMTPQSATD